MDTDPHGLFAEPMTKAEATKWLGDGNPFNERFPTIGLTETQVRTLVSFSGGRVTGLGPSPAIHKLTANGVVEINVNWSLSARDEHGSGGKLWLGGDGEYIAAAIWEGGRSDAPGPIRVYRYPPLPEGHRWRPLGSKAEEIIYEQSHGHGGSTQNTRAFIKELYTS